MKYRIVIDLAVPDEYDGLYQESQGIIDDAFRKTLGSTLRVVVENIHFMQVPQAEG